MSLLSQISIHAWIQENKIKTENDSLLDFKRHLFWFDILRDETPIQTYLKAPQVGGSTGFIIKKCYLIEKYGLNVIYTLPTKDDVSEFVSGKVDPIIVNNPAIQRLIVDKDSVSQKRFKRGTCYYRGTWTERAALSVSSDLNIYDEEDRSNLPVIEQYASRLDHSPFKWEWHLSNPSVEGQGVSKHWNISDQKHWFVKCNGCNELQFLSWPDSVCMERQVFQCKKCHKELSEKERIDGQWVRKFRDKDISGYWISHLMAPWKSAKEVIGKYNDKPIDYFHNFVLGLPYAGSDSKPTREAILSGCTEEINPQTSRMVIGVDPGLPHHYIVGNREGIFYMGKSEDYTEIEALLKNNPKAIAVFDQGGDLTPQRALREKYKGRVFLCHYRSDRKTMNLITWGEKEEEGNVVVDRNRMIDMLLGEHKMGLVTLQGTEDDWDELWQHWDNIYAVKEEDRLGVIRKEWKRKGPDHFVHAELYWRVGVDRFGATEAKIVGGSGPRLPKGLEVQPNNTISMKDLKEVLASENADFSKL